MLDNIICEFKNSLEIKISQRIFLEYKHDSIKCGCFSIGFTDFILKGKSLLEYTNLFSQNEYKKIHKMILKYFR